jgi:hypothetical protein
VELGIVGVGLLVALAWSLARHLRRRDLLVAAMYTGLVANGLFTDLIVRKEGWLPLMVGLAGLATLQFVGTNQPTPTLEPSPSAPTSSRGIELAIPAPGRGCSTILPRGRAAAGHITQARSRPW